MHCRLPLIALVLALSALAAGPAHAAGGACDPTGDANRADDCIAHSHVGATADARMRPGDVITIRERIADALRGDRLVTEEQMRRVSRDGTRGPWIGLRRTLWSAADTAKGATRTIDVCRAKLPGRYEFRTSIRSASGSAQRAMRQLSAPVATSAPTMVTLPNRALAGACANAPDDETIVEYFNQIAYNQQFLLAIADQGSSFALWLRCPPPLSADFPPADFGMALALEGQASGVACNGSPITLDKASLQAGRYAGCSLRGTVPLCMFSVLVYNKLTQTIYSDTMLEIELLPGGQTFIPNLNPATLPLCPGTLDPCVLTGTCTPSPSRMGTLTLCEGAASCTASQTGGGAVVPNSTVYFQTLLEDKIT